MIIRSGAAGVAVGVGVIVGVVVGEAVSVGAAVGVLLGRGEAVREGGGGVAVVAAVCVG